MKRAVTVIEEYCDYDYAEHEKTLVPATHIDVPLTIGDNAVTLDLCDACLELVQKTLARFTAIGTSAKTGGNPRRHTPGARQYYARLRAWADERGIKYQTPSGNTYYTEAIKRQFAEWEKENGGNPISDTPS